jgi:hypothetical protein
MAAVIKLSETLIEQARRHANLYKRSIPKQIEYWSQIGKISEENPDLPYNFIKEVLFALDEVQNEQLEDYKFNEK